VEAVVLQQLANPRARSITCRLPLAGGTSAFHVFAIRFIDFASHTVSNRVDCALMHVEHAAHGLAMTT